MDIHSPFFRNIAAVVAAILFLNPVVTLGADLALDATAGGNANLAQAGNGVPVVNIASPNSKGLSHNRFSEYNVDQQGLILNNATQAIQSTQLGGIILGNQNLKNGAAGLILNEVTGSNPSQLRGYTEVAGQAAGVIVANPHGISCNGCGFINTPRITLTTGKPLIEQGELKRFDVDQGEILIHGAGLNASNIDQFDLIARSARINAELHADELNIVAGRNQVDANTLQATAKPDDGKHKPLLAIDSSALGGMYAGAIRLVGTEQGVGVRLAGDMAASAGDIQIDASGKLTIGNASAQKKLTAQAAELETTGQLYASSRLELSSSGAMHNSDVLLAGDAVVLDSGGPLHNQGHIEAGVNSDNSRNSHGDVRLHATQINNSGTLVASRELALVADQQLDNRDGQLVAQRNMLISAGKVTNSQGSMVAGADLALTADQIDNVAGRISSAGSLELAGQTLDNRDGALAANADLQLDVALIDNRAGSVSAQRALAVQAVELDNSQGQIIAMGELDLSAGQVRNNAGRIASADALVMQADGLEQRSGELYSQTSLSMGLGGGELINDGGLISTPGALLLSNLGQVSNRGGEISSAESFELAASELDNSGGLLFSEEKLGVDLVGSLDNQGGRLQAQTRLALQAGEINNQQGLITSQGDVAAQFTSMLQSGGKVLAAGHLQLTGQQLDNQAGLLLANSELSLAVADIDNRGGEISTDRQLTVNARQLDNSDGGRLLGGHLNLVVERVLNHTRGLLQGRDGLSISAGLLDNTAGSMTSATRLALALNAPDAYSVGSLINHDGLINSDGTLTIGAQHLDNRQGTLSSAGHLQLDTQGALLNQGGYILSDAGIELHAGSLDNRAGEMSARTTLEIETGRVDNQHGQLVGLALLELNAGQVDNRQGRMASADRLQANLSGLEQQGGELFSQRQLSLQLNGGELNNDGGLISAPELLLLKGLGNVSNRDGEISSAASFELAAADLDNSAGRILSDNGLTLRIEHLLNNLSGLLAGSRIGLNAANLDNREGTLYAEEQLTLTLSESLDNRAEGLVQAGAGLLLHSGRVDNRGGYFLAADNAQLQVTGELNNQGGLINSQGQLQLQAASLDSSQGGEVSARTDLELLAGELRQAGGALIAGASLALDLQHGKLDNRGGLISAHGLLTLDNLQALDNQSGEIVSQGPLVLRAELLDNRAGQLISQDWLDLVLGHADNRGGLLSGWQGLTLRADTLDNRQTGTVSSRHGDLTVDLTEQLLNSDAGALVAGNQLAVSAAAVDNSQQGILSSTGNQQLQVTGQLNNHSGQIDAGDSLSIQARHLDNRQGLILADQQLQLGGDGVDNSGGQISSGTATRLTLTGSLNNQTGQFSSSGAMHLEATELDNRGGTLASQAELSITVQTLDNSAAGTLVAQDALTLQLTGSLDNRDEGLIVSRDAGLDIHAAQLDNQGGNLQSAADLNLSLDASLLNTDGQLISQGGDITIAANNLDNRQGLIASLGGWLRTQLSGWLNNGDADNNGGLLQAQQLELKSNGNLSNRTGQIQALEGSAYLNGAAINNQAGVLYARDQLVLVGSSLNNRDGQLGAQFIDLSLSSALNNQAGIIESSTYLQLQASSLDNRGGQVRALGSNGTSFFELGGQLNNTAGVVELANQNVSLVMTGLANQQGRLLHAGHGNLGLSLAQINGAGGEIITAGDLNLSGSSWNNSGLLQARHLQLNIGSLTQTSSGQLLATEMLTGQGGNWSNAGLIASDGSLSVALSGDYSAAGHLTSLGDLELNAASLSLLEAARIAAGGSGQLTLGNQLLNHGRITALDDLNVHARVLDNYGTLGSASDLALNAQTLLNQQGLIFSGADMRLYTNRFTNRYADVYSLGNLLIEGQQQNSFSALVENISATIEAAGNLVARASSLINRKDRFALTAEQTAGRIDVHCYDCSGDHHNVDYIATETFSSTVSEDSPAALLLSGSGMTLEAGTLTNRYSTIATAGNLLIETAQLQNIGAAETATTRVRTWNTGRTTDGTDERFRAAYLVPYNAAALPKELPLEALARYTLVSDIITDTSTGIAAPAIIQAAEAATLRVAGNLDNSVVLHQAVTIGNARAGDTAVGNSTTPVVVTLNPQLPPDLAQQQVNPLALPGLSLPTGQNGLFRLSGQAGSDIGVREGSAQQDWDLAQHNLLVGVQREGVQTVQGGQIDNGTPVSGTPVNLEGQAVPPPATASTQPPGHGLLASRPAQQHRYLIETNPALTDLKQFMGSDYLLSNMGYNPDHAHKRLGDGLYEQRLVREAIMARTGQRYLAGLTSDEAMYRYLMDNALASKDVLQLSLGVSLSAEQVAALTHDIVWLEEHEVMGERVLVPVLYLAQAEGRLMANGALIQGADLLLISGGNLNNQGTLRASNHLAASAGNIANSGLIEAGNRLSLLSLGDISNRAGGIIAGRDVSLIASGDLLNERSATHYQNEGQSWRQGGTLMDSAARIEAAGDLTLQAGRDLLNIGGTLQAGGDARLSAGDDLVISAVEERSDLLRQDRRHFIERGSVTQHGSEITVGGSLQASADNDLAIIASQVQTGDDLTLAAGGDVLIASAANEQHDVYRYRRSDKKVTRETSRVSQQQSEVQAGGDLTILSSDNLIVSSSRLEAGGEAYLVAGDQLALLAAEDLDHSFYEKKSKGSFGRKSFRSDQVTRITQQGTEITTGGDLALISGGDQTYQTASLRSGADLELVSGGAISFEGVKDLHQESHEKSKSSWAWQSAKGKGNTDETLIQSQLIAQGELAIKAVEGLQIDIKHIDQRTLSQTIDAMVQADPNLAWLKEMEQRGDVDWQRVKEVHDSFSYSSSGLGAGAQLVIAIAIAAVVGPAASGLAGGSAMGAAAGAAASGAASTAAISTINNRGDLGAVLSDVTSSDSLKNYAVAGATAGLTVGVYDGWTGTQTAASNTGVASGNTGVLANTGNVTGAGLNSWTGVGQFATNQALQNTTSAVLNKALGQDGNLGDALTATLANTFAAVGFNWVGDISQANQWQSGSLQKVGLHAIMGGLAAEAAGGDFKTGALVAGANEVLIDSLAQQYSGMAPDQRIGLLTMNSQVLGVLVASMAGGDEQDMQIGASVAGNATKYNWDLHLPQGLMEYGESATSMADYLQPQGASPEEVNQALRAMARGEGFEGPDPAQAFLKAWATAMLTGGGVISHTAKGVTLVLGGALGGGANVSYQITNKDLEALNITDAAVATAVGALTQGKGLAGSVGVNMGGAYIGSQVKGTDAGSAVVGAGVGSVLGHGAGKILGDKAKAITPGGAGESLGALGGAISSEVVSDKIGSLLGGGEN